MRTGRIQTPGERPAALDQSVCVSAPGAVQLLSSNVLVYQPLGGLLLVEERPTAQLTPDAIC